MRILVVGGTRFFGLDVVTTLAQRGDDVVVLSRRPVDGVPARAIAGERSDADTLARVRSEAARKPFDAVFDNIAMNAAHIGGMLDALAGRCGHYVLTSTGSVYDNVPGDRPLVEDDWLPGRERAGGPMSNSYGEGKREAERTLYARGGEVARWTVLRPTIVFGPRDPTERLAWYVKTLLAGKPVGPVGFVFNPVFSSDLARLAVRVLDNPPPSGRAYNVAGREVVSVRDLCVRIQGILQIPGPGLDMPGRPEEQPPLPQSGRFVMAIERALQELRFDPTGIGSWLEMTAGMIQQGRG